MSCFNLQLNGQMKPCYSGLQVCFDIYLILLLYVTFIITDESHSIMNVILPIFSVNYGSVY